MSSETKSVALSFRPSNAEINELHLTFNKVAKTMDLARLQGRKGQEDQALLNFSEGYNIFEDFNNIRAMGICMSNIGAIHFESKRYLEAKTAIGVACDLMQMEIVDEE